jgi:hypothetical protein
MEHWILIRNKVWIIPIILDTQQVLDNVSCDLFIVFKILDLTLSKKSPFKTLKKHFSKIEYVTLHIKGEGAGIGPK